MHGDVHVAACMSASGGGTRLCSKERERERERARAAGELAERQGFELAEGSWASRIGRGRTSSRVRADRRFDDILERFSSRGARRYDRPRTVLRPWPVRY